jgi:inosine triphosphate pyrophosphatase
MKQPIFVTGNQHKADHLAKLLGIPLKHQKIDVDEIQSPYLEEVAAHKAKQAYAAVQKPVLVEDVALSFAGLDGLPGPFIKFFISIDDGLEKMCRIADVFETRQATGECVYAYYDGERLELFHGRLDGKIADTPKGDNGFGWDAIFCPEGYDGRTRAELTDAEYDEVYLRIKPIDKIRAFLKS